MTDHIDKLLAAHEARLRDEMESAFLAWLATVNTDMLASSLDDDDRDHIRAQLRLILDLDDSGVPTPLADALAHSSAPLLSAFDAIAALAASQAGHVVNANDATLAQASPTSGD